MAKFSFRKGLVIVAASVFAISGFTSCISSGDLKGDSRPALKISASDKPVGVGNATMQTGDAVTVSNKEEFLAALVNGGLIYVNGMIDLSDGYMPTTAGGSTEKLDALVAEKTAGQFANYAEYKAAYVEGCTVATNDKKKGQCTSDLGDLMWDLNNAYKAIIRPTIKSNTTIIGITETSGFNGGTFILGKADGQPVENIVLRNLVLQNAYDPFPHHEANDGFNSQHDVVCIQDGAHDIWIDHCTFLDTVGIDYVTIGDGTEEKYQTFDGLLDMKSVGTDNITVSYCKFMNHDKTMLIGSSDTELKNGNRNVTLHHNLFVNCGQRLPMVRQTNLHVYNNVYLSSNPTYKSQYAIGVRNEAMILSENNYFGDGIEYSYSGAASKQGSVYAIGDLDESKNGKKPDNFITLEAKPFVPAYEYTLDAANKVKAIVEANAGAGAVSFVN